MDTMKSVLAIAQIKIEKKIYIINVKRKVQDAKYDAKTGGKKLEECGLAEAVKTTDSDMWTEKQYWKMFKQNHR